MQDSVTQALTHVIDALDAQELALLRGDVAELERWTAEVQARTEAVPPRQPAALAGDARVRELAARLHRAAYRNAKLLLNARRANQELLDVVRAQGLGIAREA